MAERKIVGKTPTVAETDPSLDKSADLLARIVAHQLDKIRERADQWLELNAEDIETLKMCGQLLASMKRMRPDGVPMAILRRAGLTGAQFEAIGRLLEAEDAKA